MTTKKQFRPYPAATLQMDRMGSLHVWRGEVVPVRVDKYLYHVNGNEADLYVQSQDDVQAILNDLPVSEREDIENGWHLTTYFFNDEYFGE